MAEENRAVAARKAGNKALVSGNPEQAIAEYTEGLKHDPRDYLLLGNRSEAMLMLKRSEEALADANACLECSDGKWCKGYLRKANAEVALGKTRDAIQTLRLGMRELGPDAPVQPWLDKLASVKELHFAVRVEDDNRMGKILRSNKPFVMGDIVFQEHPIMKWIRPDASTKNTAGDQPVTMTMPKPPTAPTEVLKEYGNEAEDNSDINEQEPGPSQSAQGDGDIPSELKAVCDSHGLSYGFVAILPPFMKLGAEERKVVLKCVAPSIPLSPIAVAIVSLSNQISQLPQFSELGQMTIIRLLMINKVNSHRLHDSYAGIYEVASKMAHSCAPNVLYDGTECRFIAFKNIPKDGLVSFSYNASLYLVHSSEVRQTVLRQTHLFVCKCERCTGIDYTRGIRCNCGKGTATLDSDDAIRFRMGTRLLDEEAGLSDNKAWSCKGCKQTWSDKEMGNLLERENNIEQQVHMLSQQKDTVEKGQYEKLKELTERCLQTLSRDHWCYLVLTNLLANYCYQLARRTRGSASELLKLAVLWGKKYSAGLTRTRVTEFAPMIFVEWGYWISLVCGDWPHLMHEKIRFLESTYPTYSTLYPEEPATKRISRILTASKKRLERYRTKINLGKAYKSMEYDYDESELFDLWENHLADMYVNEAKKHPGDHLKSLLSNGHVDPLSPVAVN
eukprot:TRINITY_DN17166_c0_g1_i1.p1 TRINITY_DN17166_c0_g1~~TRINITY_DN17166_c0_g1_i1.p1  ORF type:complete len:675 (+),score=145.91 TRINITY_DN17166_c0_g1_i1:55-2079(+)